METEQKETKEQQKKEESKQFLVDLSQMSKEEFDTKRHKKRVKGLRGKKKLMVEALIAKLGIITDACRLVGIERKTHYRWLESDPKYKEATKDADIVLKDFGEKALIQIMSEKNPQAILHFNKTKNRDRGYGDQLSLEHSGQITNKIDKIEVEVIRTNETQNETQNKDNENL
jgi:hypothetical protein